MFAKAKDKFGERHFDYKLFTTSALKIFTDALHGKPPIRRNQNYNPCNKIMLTQEINYMQLIAFLSFDGQLTSEFEHKFMRFAVRWITDGLFNHRYEYTSKKFAIMVFYFLSFNQGSSRSLKSCFPWLPKLLNPKSSQSQKLTFDFNLKSTRAHLQKSGSIFGD